MRVVAEVAADATIAEDVAAVAVVDVAVDAEVVVTAAGPRAEHRHKSGSCSIYRHSTDADSRQREHKDQILHPQVILSRIG